MKITATKFSLPCFFVALLFLQAPLFGDPADQNAVGTVVDAEGRPVAGATVTLNGPDDSPDILRKTQADENGRFEFDLSVLDPAGLKPFLAYSLIAVPKESETEKKSVGIFVKMPFAVEKPDEKNIEIKMEPAVTIRGRVLDAADKPVTDAQVALCPFHRFGLPEMLTNDDGNFQGVAPRSYFTEAEYLTDACNWRAFKDGYAVALERIEPVPNNATAIPLLILRLSDTRKKAMFRAIDKNGQPKKNIAFSFSHLVVRSGSETSGFFIIHITRRTDADGRAEFDLVPAWASDPLTFYVSDDDGWSPKKRPVFDPKNDNGKEITVEMLAPVPLSGTILKEDGTPFFDTEITISSLANENSFFHKTIKTDSNGKFTLPVFPEQVYGPPQITGPAAKQYQIFGREDDDRVVHPGKPVSDFNFTARKVVAVHGNLHFPDDYKEGSAQETFTLGIDGKRFLPVYFYTGDTLPEPSLGNYRRKTAFDSQGNELSYLKSSDFSQTSFHDDKSKPGRFTVWLPSGTFTVAGNVEQKTFEVKPSETEITLDLTVCAAKESFSTYVVVTGKQKTMAGRVVRRVEDETVPASGIIVEEEGIAKTTSGEDGIFTLETTGHHDDVAVYVRTKDFSEVGFGKVVEQDEAVEIELKPVASLKGRLVDSKTGKPIVDSKIECIGPVRTHERIMTPPYFKDIRSDKDGRISMTGFVPGLTYQMQCEPAENAVEGTSAMLGFFLAPEPGEFDADDIAVVDIRSGNQLVDFVMQPFKQEGTAKERFEAAKKRSAKTKKPVLLVFVEAGTDEDGEAFMMWVFQAAFGIQGRKFLAGFEYVPVDLSQEFQEKTKAAELLDELKIEMPGENDFLICVVDADGKFVTKRNAADFRAPSFESDGELKLEFDSVLLLTFLREFGK